ncbi:hypothetical protein BDZ97DRAFT_755574 [Flammula alnicola]|nr:hypothetical protein BDZ97DRAFT_755574 [Flammula alnicola]
MADEIPASSLELLTKDWKDVLRHAKGMQLAMNRFTRNLEMSVNEDHDGRSEVAQAAAFYANQLSDVGDLMLGFVEAIEKDVEPLAKALVAEPSDEGALGAAVLEIADASQPEPTEQNLGAVGPESQPTPAVEPLSPEAQAIGEGFERILEGKHDPRMGYGRILPQEHPGEEEKK